MTFVILMLESAKFATNMSTAKKDHLRILFLWTDVAVSRQIIVIPPITDRRIMLHAASIEIF